MTSPERGAYDMLPVSRRLTVPGLLLAALFASCSGGQSGPECRVGTDGIAEQAITGVTLATATLSLTFDRSPTLQTADVAELLSNRLINGTFFVLGTQLQNGLSELSHLRALGHLVANGTYSGRALDKATLPAAELRKVDQLITPYVVGNMFLFRAPYNAFNRHIAGYLNRQGLQKYVGPIGWDVAAEDGSAIDVGCWAAGLTPGECAQRYLLVIAQKKLGIVRLTDGYSQLFALLQELLPALESAGFKFARLDAVPEVSRALRLRGAETGGIGGAGGCNDYR